MPGKFLASGARWMYNKCRKMLQGEVPANGQERVFMGREFELKYQASPETIASIQSKFGEFTPIAMETTYFDTADLALRQRKWTLRLRLENGKSVCTVKTPLPDGSRGEWEVEASGLRSAVPRLCAMGAPAEILDYVNQGVTPFCGARFTRLAKAIDLPGGSVELALDRGVLLGGGQELPFAEVEVELKSGDDSTAQSFADTLASEFGLTEQPQSKLARAMAL